MRKIGRNTNINDTAVVSTYLLNSATATTIAAPNPDRIHFSVCLAHGITNEDAYIRFYPAATDNAKRGETITRDTMGNTNLYRPSFSMSSDNIYTGEISAISASGNVFVSVTEY